MNGTDAPAHSRDGLVRLLALACVYGLAVVFAVACAPGVRLVTLGHPAQIHRTAAL